MRLTKAPKPCFFARTRRVTRGWGSGTSTEFCKIDSKPPTSSQSPAVDPAPFPFRLSAPPPQNPRSGRGPPAVT